MKKKRNAVILWKKRNNYGKNVMVGTSVYAILQFTILLQKYNIVVIYLTVKDIG